MSAVLLEHFENLALGQGGVGKLREMILTLAVQGKLAEQDLKEKPHVPSMADGSFEIPPNWSWTYLSSLCSVVTDGDHLPPPKTDSGVPFLVIGNVKGGRLNFDGVRFVSPEYYGRIDEARKPRRGDVLYTVVGSFGIPVLVDLDREFCVQRHIAILKPHEFVNNNYLFFLLRSDLVYKQAEEVATGIAQKTVTLGGLRKIRVPLPPLPEQRRIVAKVDELMRLCHQLEQSTAQSETARRALLHSLLAAGAWAEVLENLPTLLQTPEDVAELRKGILELAVRGKLVEQDSREKALMSSTTEGDFEIPLNWSWNIVQDAFDVSGGIQKTPQRQPVKNFYPYLRVANVQRNRLVLAEIHNFELFEGELEKYRLQDKDLLVVEGNGSEDEIGRCAIWNAKIENCVHQNHIMRVRARVSGIQEFTLLFFNSPTGIAEMKARAITTSGLYTLSVGKIRTIQIPLPPLPEQHRIVAKVDQLMALCDQLEAALHKSNQTLAAALASAVAQAV